MEYNINNNYLELISGTSNFTSKVYREAADNVDKGTPKGMAYLKNFLTSIEKVSEKVSDSRISSSKGNIKNFKGYNDIKFSISFLNKHMKDLPGLKDCTTVFDALENWSALYENGYTKNIRLMVLEYETSVFMLTTTLASLFANNVEFVSNGTEIKITKKTGTGHGVIDKTMADLAKQLGDRSHKEYLDALVSSTEGAVTESVYTEAALELVTASLKLIGETLDNIFKIGKSGARLIKLVKKSVFGIVPLIRSAMYIWYKRKADTIVALEEQVVFIQRNIEQLEKNQTVDPAKKAVIIKKQKAIIEARLKKAAKLRAELMETEKQAAVAIEKDNTKIGDTSTNDDLILEAALFTEATTKRPKRLGTHAQNKGPKKSDEDIHYMRSITYVDRLNSKVTAPIDIKKSELEKNAKAAVEILINNTKKPSIRLFPGKSQPTDTDIKKRTVTKIGGIPYWPKNAEWPKYKNKDMVCYAQLNFDQLPALKGFPTIGLLQFFVTGSEYDDKGTNCKIIYHKTYNEKDLLDVPPRSTLNDPMEDYPVIKGVYYPTAKLVDSVITTGDEHWGEEFTRAINKAFGTNYTYFKLPREIEDAVYKCLCKTIEEAGCRIGGNPFFTQNDTRDKDHTEMLLQLDSEAGMMWGDVGVANFFCSKDTLKTKDFEGKVKYTWDCY